MIIMGLGWDRLFPLPVVIPLFNLVFNRVQKYDGMSAFFLSFVEHTPCAAWVDWRPNCYEDTAYDNTLLTPPARRSTRSRTSLCTSFGWAAWTNPLHTVCLYHSSGICYGQRSFNSCTVLIRLWLWSLQRAPVNWNVNTWGKNYRVIQLFAVFVWLWR